MFSWTRLSHLAQWSAAKVEHAGDDFPVTGICTDTRQLKRGDLFFALRGENFDGNDFVEAAARAGASAVIAERSFSLGVPVLVVENGLSALVAIGEGLRNQFPGKVAAVTGSAGKSSTKDMLACLLGPETVASPASFNNLMGVSRTLFLVEDSTRFLVLEMGMNARGEIAELCRHFRPQAGAITNIGDAHIGKLGGKEGIFQAKKELFAALAPLGSTALGVALNLDDPLVQRAYRDCFARGVRTVTYSALGAAADVAILRKGMDPATGFLSLSLKVHEKTLDVSLPIFGLHHAQNIAAALAMGHVLGATLEEMRPRLAAIRPASHRGEVFLLPEGRILIDESYNSNPTALRSSLTSLSDLDPSRRRILVLGEMKELGEFSESLHAEAGKAIVELNARSPFPFLIIGVGEFTGALIHAVRGALPEAECWQTRNAEEALQLLPTLLRPRDAIFVKGSRGVKLDTIVERMAGVAGH